MDCGRADRGRGREGHHAGWRSGGIILTILLGIAGAFLGGFLASALGIGAGVAQFDMRTILVAIAGAIVLLFAYRALTSASGRRS